MCENMYERELNDILSFLKQKGLEPFYDEYCNRIDVYEEITDDVIEQLEASFIVNEVSNEYEYTYDEMDIDYDCFSHVSIYLFADDDE